MAGPDRTMLPLVLRNAVVDRVTRLNPRTVRVRLTGPELAAFERDGISLPAFSSPGFDDHVKLIFSTGGDLAEALPVQREHGIDWPRCDHRAGRDYTVRTVDPEAGTIDLDFVDHGPGPAASWARDAAPGDDVWFAGPKSSMVLPHDLDWIVLVGDETALPAIARFFEERPTRARAHVVATVPDESARQEWAIRDDDSVQWVVDPNVTPEQIEQTVRDVLPPRGSGFVWAAGESRSLLPLRRHLTKERGLAKDRLDITGYWHRRAEDQPGVKGSRWARMSPLPWLVTRAALQIGLLDALTDGPRPLADLATATGVPAERLAVLLPTLTTAGLLRRDGELLALGPMGEDLLDDDHRREGFDGLDGELLAGLVDLAPALRRGSVPLGARSGRTLWQSVTADAEEFAEQIEEADAVAHMLPGLERHPVWQGVDSVTVTGPGSGRVASMLERVEPAPTIAVVAAAPVQQAVRESVPVGTAILDSAASADVTVDAGSCRLRTDQELVAHLTALRAVAPTAVLLDEFAPDGLSPAAGQHGLLTFSAVGRAGGRPTIERLATTAGWSVREWTELGWGFSMVVLDGAKDT